MIIDGNWGVEVSTAKPLFCHTVISELCKITGKYGLFLSFPDTEWEEVRKAAPYIDLDTFQMLSDGVGWFLFDTEAEMQHYYDLTVGEDGPTKLNPYNGPARVYAATYNSDGLCCTENT